MSCLMTRQIFPHRARLACLPKAASARSRLVLDLTRSSQRRVKETRLLLQDVTGLGMILLVPGLSSMCRAAVQEVCD